MAMSVAAVQLSLSDCHSKLMMEVSKTSANTCLTSHDLSFLHPLSYEADADVVMSVLSLQPLLSHRRTKLVVEVSKTSTSTHLTSLNPSSLHLPPCSLSAMRRTQMW